MWFDLTLEAPDGSRHPARYNPHTSEAEGLPLPKDWRARFPADPLAPSVGMNAGFGKLFLARHARAIGQDPSERIHPAVAARKRMKRGWTLALPRFRRPAS